MARKLRAWYPGAMYHITSRGNRQSALFMDDIDRKTYLEILEKTRSNHPFHLHAYCLMTNHIHLQLATTSHHIKDIMKMLNSRYAMYFNKRYDLVGHVFQGRYGSELIETIGYLLDVSRYIHLNPVKAEMVSAPEAYYWSSYRAYVTDEENPHVTTNEILSHFPAPKKENYRVYVESEITSAIL